MSLDVTRKAKAGSSVTQLLYRSRSLIGSGSALQMSGILAEARPANARDDITGVLTSVEGRFVQIVEGRAEVIQALMQKLVKDVRHTDVTVLETRLASTRAFGDWDMVSPVLARLELTAVSRLLNDASAGLDDYIAVLGHAVARQSAVLEGRSSTSETGLRHPGPGSTSMDGQQV